MSMAICQHNFIYGHWYWNGIYFHVLQNVILFLPPLPAPLKNVKVILSLWGLHLTLVPPASPGVNCLFSSSDCAQSCSWPSLPPQNLWVD